MKRDANSMAPVEAGRPLTLYGLVGAWGLTTVSPFTLEVEAYLRWRGIAYVLHYANPMQMPKGKLPALRVGASELWTDSRLIVERLERIRESTTEPVRAERPPLDILRTAAEVAGHYATCRLAKDSLFWWAQYFRWKDRQSAKATAAAFAPHIPAGRRPFVLMGLKKRMRADLWAQGAGRLDADEAFELAKRDVRALSGVLGAGPYFGGASPGTVDAAVWGQLEAVVGAGVDTPLKAYIQSRTELAAYTRRVRDELHGFQGGWPI